jgi:hypothetical protein
MFQSKKMDKRLAKVGAIYVPRGVLLVDGEFTTFTPDATEWFELNPPVGNVIWLDASPWDADGKEICLDPLIVWREATGEGYAAWVEEHKRNLEMELAAGDLHVSPIETTRGAGGTLSDQRAVIFSDKTDEARFVLRFGQGPIVI